MKHEWNCFNIMLSNSAKCWTRLRTTPPIHTLRRWCQQSASYTLISFSVFTFYFSSTSIHLRNNFRNFWAVLHVSVISQPCLASRAIVSFMGSGNLSNKSFRFRNMQWLTSRQFFSRSWPSENIIWIAATPLSAVPSAAKNAYDKTTFSYPDLVVIFRMIFPKYKTLGEVSSLWWSNTFTTLDILYPPIVLVSTDKTIRHLWKKSPPGK